MSSAPHIEITVDMKFFDGHGYQVGRFTAKEKVLGKQFGNFDRNKIATKINDSIRRLANE